MLWFPEKSLILMLMEAETMNFLGPSVPDMRLLEIKLKPGIMKFDVIK